MGLRRFKNKYYNIVYKSLEKNWDIIIDSFVEYYGEEYRKVVDNRCKNAIIFLYVNFDIIESLLENKAYSDKLQFEILDKYYQEYKREKVPEYDNLLGIIPFCNPDDIYNVIEEVSCYFTDTSPRTIGLLIDGDLNPIITYPVFLFASQPLIHELNHLVCYGDTMLKAKNTPILKAGVDSYNGAKNEINILDELLNEMSSWKVYEIFKSKGGNLSDFSFKSDFFEIPYISNLYLIEEFYQEFEDLIKIAQITENNNELFYRVGKDNMNKFLNVIDQNFLIEKSDEEIVKIKRDIHEIILRMKESVSKTGHFTEEELDDYFKTLEDKGLKLKKCRGSYEK